jgi:hypothetical protein
MNGEELRDRLAAVDPARDAATEPPTTASARTRLERIMQTDPNTATATPTETSTTTSTNTSTTGPNRGRIWLAAAAAAIVVVAAGVVLAGGDDDPSVASGPPVELSLGVSDAMASCLPVDAELLAEMPLAFAGTATEVEGETVTLAVEEWYVGGDTGTVVLRSQAGMEALIDGFAFEDGADYLVSASDGSVNFCGFSGPATAELRALYEAAFRS